MGDFPLLQALPRPDFAVPVPPFGYRWWYVDALSDDHRFGLTIIAFVGSVFSPYYAASRRKGRGDPENHVSLNVALYGASGHRWAMTERSARALKRDRDTYEVGRSRIAWHNETLTIDIDEWMNPIPRRLKGRVTLTPRTLNTTAFVLDANARHTWQPIAPLARATIELEHPDLTWSGSAYLDTNAGSEPLEAGFSVWDWSRTVESDVTRIFYDGTRRDGSPFNLAIAIGPDGVPQTFDAPPRARLSTTAWGIKRATRSTVPGNARVIETLENTPFYARSAIEARIGGDLITSMHESLDLNRFNSRIVQAMLPFRMPRRG